MQVAVLIIFLVFSYSGVVILNVSSLSSASSVETVNNIKLQDVIDSSIHEPLWRLNNGPDISENGVIPKRLVGKPSYLKTILYLKYSMNESQKEYSSC
ncbi:MAG: hypothetical protein K9M55_09110 [Candidatus Marinimicrobia bacterium]|nr:hypothetical protein [Candidatus Neomarinimicrobiota bacterium]